MTGKLTDRAAAMEPLPLAARAKAGTAALVEAESKSKGMMLLMVVSSGSVDVGSVDAAGHALRIPMVALADQLMPGGKPCFLPVVSSTASM